MSRQQRKIRRAARRPDTQVFRAAPVRAPWLLPLGLLAVTLATYWPAVHGGLLWDDPAHITRPELRSIAGLWRIWFDVGATQQYYPVTHSAFWLQWHLWGSETTGYHLVNILLHGGAAYLVFLLARRLALPGAALAAFVFAVHPVHVESVAWITELKNTLSAVLVLSAALAYLRHDESRRRGDYGLALALFVLALLAKTVTAVLPAALLVLFWWQRGRVSATDVRPLLPFFGFGAAAGLLTIWIERTLIGAEGAEFAYGLIERILIAGRVFWFYLAKLAWPADLTFIYPRWEISAQAWPQYLYPAAALLLVCVLWLLRIRTRAPLAVVLLYGGLLFPVLGFFNVFPFRYSFVADHFAYLASIPLLAGGVAGAVSWARRASGTRGAAGIRLAGTVLVGVLAVLSWRQAHDYVSAETLYRATLQRNPGGWMAHNNLGLILAGDGRGAEARRHFEEAVRLNPSVTEHHTNLGRVLLQAGETDEAIARFDEALRLNPALPNAHSDKGLALLRTGRFDGALREFERALALAPQHPEASVNRALALRARGVSRVQAGDSDRGLEDLRAAVAARPEDPDFRHDLGVALATTGRLGEAVEQLEAALRLRPAFPEARENLARVRAELRPSGK